MSGIEHTRGGRIPLRRHARVLAAVAALLVAAPAAAQTPAPGWILIVRIVPNPMPIGRCGGITVELQDDEGYRRNELSNGGVIDFHKFKYDADTTNFQWQNGKPIDGVICTRAGSPPSSVTVTVTLPDGLSGSAQLTSKAVGGYAAAVQYAKQGPLRIPGVPPPHASTVRGATGGAPAGGTVAASPPSAGSAPAGTATNAGTPAAAPTRTSAGAPTKTALSTGSRNAITTSVLGMTGGYFTGATTQATTSALGMTGGYFAGATTQATTSALGMTGGYFAGAATQVTTSALGMTGGYFTSGGVAVTTTALSMTGTSSTRVSKPGTAPTRVPY